MSPCFQSLGITPLVFVAALAGGTILTIGGATFIIGTVSRWKWLVDPSGSIYLLCKKLFGSDVFIRWNYIYGIGCVLIGASLLCSFWPALRCVCR
jgi:hypothetical protein